MYKIIFRLLLLIGLIIVSGCTTSRKETTVKCPDDYINRLALLQVPTEDIGISLEEGIYALKNVESYWPSEIGCYSGIQCENLMWVIYEQGEGCEVALQAKVNGIVAQVPVYYINIQTDEVFASASANSVELGRQIVNLYKKITGQQPKLP
jgi:hypothetical protein